MKEEYYTGIPEINDILEFLTNWLVEHILHTDKQIGQE